MSKSYLSNFVNKLINNLNNNPINNTTINNTINSSNSKLLINNKSLNNNINNNNNSSINKRKSIYAFSLIELSIVLIIIGLLIAGVVAGRSLINSARVRSIINEARNLEVDLYAYYARNNYFPTARDSESISFENNCNVWKELYDEKITNFEVTSCDDSDTSKINKNSTYSFKGNKSLMSTIGYNSYFGGNTLFIISSDNNNNSESTDTLENISHKSSASVQKFDVASLSNKIAYGIDTKLDNGVIDSGKVQSFSANSSNEECDYSKNNSSVSCVTGIRIGLLSGKAITGDVGSGDSSSSGSGDSSNTDNNNDNNNNNNNDNTDTDNKVTCSSSSLSYTNASYNGESTSVDENGTLSLTCNTGYTGSITATCGSSGSWSYSGSCSQITCNNSGLTFTNATFSNTSGTTNVNGTQTATCNTGYTGSITATCGSDGSWGYSGECAEAIGFGNCLTGKGFKALSISTNSITVRSANNIANSGNNCTIKWGDGQTDSCDGVKSISHNYSSTNQWTVEICGNDWNGLYAYYTYSSVSNPWIKELIYYGDWPNLDTAGWAFNDSSNLEKVHSGAFDGVPNVTSFEGIFRQTKLASVPSGLFDKNVKVTNFAWVFTSTYISSVPSGIFDNNIEAKDFSAAFQWSKIVSIPSDLFNKNTKVIDFSYVFDQSLMKCVDIDGNNSSTPQTNSWPKWNASGVNMNYAKKLCKTQ